MFVERCEKNSKGQWGRQLCKIISKKSFLPVTFFHLETLTGDKTDFVEILSWVPGLHFCALSPTKAGNFGRIWKEEIDASTCYRSSSCSSSATRKIE